jgi:hypothetical protein
MRPATAERVWFLGAVLCTVLAWTVFGLAAVAASLYTASHAFRGFEWVGGFLMTLSLVGFCAMPRLDRPDLSSPEERGAHRTAVHLRVVFIVVGASLGFAIGAVTAFVEWFAPPKCFTRTNASGQSARGFHTSPSPSAAPTTHSCGTDPIAGALILGELALHWLAIACAWLSSEASRRADLPEDDDFDNARL